MEKYSWLSMDSIELEDNFQEMCKVIPKDLDLDGILTIGSIEDLYKVVNSYRETVSFYSKDKYFITEKRKLAFLLKKHEKGIFDEELGIKKKHYIDKNAAKEWRIKFSKDFHPDKNQGDVTLDFDEISQCINKIYNRMVGKA